MEITIKSYSELNRDELYALLQLRSEVFVVEQNCVYQDIDGKDQKAYHVLGYKSGKLVAYTRLFKPGDYFELASIGRVVVKLSERKHQYGHQIMEASIQGVTDLFDVDDIKISAQCYLKSFYNRLGFKEIGDEYLEDDIPHIAMILKS